MSFPRYESYKDSGVEWLGDVPEHWGIGKFRHNFIESPEKIESDIVGEMLSVSGYRGIEIKEYDDDNRRRLDSELVGYRIVRHGQLVVNTMWLNYAGLGVSDYEGYVSPAYRSYWICPDFDKRYIHHLMRSDIYVKGYTKYLTGIRPNSLQMGRDDLLAFPILKPSHTEQNKIATFLDRETTKIDALIAEQQRLIELLKEKRQAVISHAVTKGLNPDTPMKDSGIEWLGEVPAHWEVSRIKYHCEIKGRIGFRGYTTADQVDEGSGALTLGATHITETGEINLDEPIYISWEKYYESPEIMVSTSNILVVQRGSTCGKIGFVETDIGSATINPSLVLLKNFSCLPKLMFFYLSSALVQGLFELVLGNTAIPMLSQEQIGDIAFCLPPFNEQEKIIHFIANQTNKLDTLTAEAKLGIELLQERRTALVSAAVTGKIDVRGLVSTALPEEAAA